MSGAVAAETAATGTFSAKRWWATSRARHPEWGLALLAAAGWMMLASAQLRQPIFGSESGSMTGSGHALHRGYSTPAATDLDELGSWAVAAAGHVAVLLAMVAVMAPLVAANARFAALRSPRRARRAAIVSVTSGWAAVWLVAVLVLAGAAHVAVAATGASVAVAAATVLAVGWQWTDRKRRSLSRCHRYLAPPLRPKRARRACLAFGRSLGVDCAVSCAPLMLIMMVGGHQVLVVALLTAVAWHERRRRPHHDPGPGSTSIAIAVAGTVSILLLWMGVG